MTDDLTHLDERGRARMVDVGEKSLTHRVCIARCEVKMAKATLSRITDGTMPKGDVLATARIAGIQAAKRTGEWIPLCHALPLDWNSATSPSTTRYEIDIGEQQPSQSSTNDCS